MANISGYLNNIKSAGRGEDVRDSIINALNAINADNPSKIKPLNVTANGTYTGDGGIVYNPITVNVPEGAASALTLKDINITENGEYEVEDGEAYRAITVDVPQYVNEILDEITITANGEYDALLDGYDGYGKITVNVQQGGTGTFTVTFYASDRTTVLQKVVNVPAGGGAVYQGPNPTSSGMRFVGWTPNPMQIYADTNCYPRFENLVYDETQIQDDWVTIAKNVRNNPDAYSIGQWKLLELNGLAYADMNDLTKSIYRNKSGGSTIDDFKGAKVKMVLVAKGVDPLEGENGYAPTTWVSGSIANYESYFMQFGELDVNTVNFNWLTCSLRAFLQDQFTTNIFPQELLPYVRRTIKKTSIREGATDNFTSRSYPSIEWFWIPSSREVFGTCTNLPTNASYVGDLNATIETEGPAYGYFGERIAGVSDYTETMPNRVMYVFGTTEYYGRGWATRSNTLSRNFSNAQSSVVLGPGGDVSGASSGGGNTIIGFCL